MQFEPIVFQSDSPLSFELLLHSQFRHDLSRLHGHPVFNGVDLGVLEPWATDVAHEYFFLLNTQPTHILRRRIELCVQYHTGFLVIIVSQLVLWQPAARALPIIIALLVVVVRTSDQVRLLLT